MASAATSSSTFLRPNFTSPLFPPPKNPTKTPRTLPVRCGGGPRSNRGPLLKGRILSTEAILAIQSLKRSSLSKSSTPPPPPPPNLSRLVRPDLVAILRELLRQDRCSLALHVLSTLRAEYPDYPPGLDLYADVIFSLGKNKLGEEIDRVVEEMDGGDGGVELGSDKGLVRVVRGAVEAGRKESTVRIVEMMRRSGCGETWTADEYVVKALSRGLRAMGEEALAVEVQTLFPGPLGRRGSFGNKTAL